VNGTDKEEPKKSDRNLSQCHFFHHKSHMDQPGLRGERPASNCLRGRPTRILVLYKGQYQDKDAWVYVNKNAPKTLLIDALGHIFYITCNVARVTIIIIIIGSTAYYTPWPLQLCFSIGFALVPYFFILGFQELADLVPYCQAT
jgi:hypothetical protein